MKKHFKMYKAGKLWYTAAIVTAAFGIFTASSQTAHADTTTNQVQTEQTVASQNVAMLSSRQAPATATPTNEVPQDTTTVNNQVNTNRGWLDHYDLTENNSGQAQIQASGWHVSGQSNSDPYRWVIVYDNTQGHEVVRQQLTPQTRSDVQRAYSDVDNSLHSGFNTTLNIPNSVINDSLSLITRYSSDATYGEGNHVDYWFGPLATDHSNRANLDSLKSNGRVLTVSGWHATNQAANRPYHYIIAFDQTAGHEIARQEVKNSSRPDVARTFPTIANAGRSGFSVNFNLTPPYFNDQIQFISRWTDDPAGNGNAIDYWFNPITKNNRSWLDGYSLSNGHLQVAGWHADDISLLEPNHFLIVFDNTTGRQVASASVPLNASDDVARAYGDTKTANRARFNYNLGRLSLIPGHNYSLVSRYSATNQGNGNNGAHTDAWLNLGNFNQAASWVDNANVDHRNLTISGWMTNDQAMTKPYAYAIVLQNGHEIGRQALTLTERDDVARAYPQIYRSQYSGFTTHFTLPSDSLNNLQLVLRFTDDRAGNGNTADRWINLRQTTSAAQALQNAINRQQQANQALANAQQQVNIAQVAYNAIGDHGAAVNSAAQNVTNAQQAKSQADAQVNTAQNNVNSAQTKLNSDQTALDNANQTVPSNGDDGTQAGPSNPEYQFVNHANNQQLRDFFQNENPNQNARYLTNNDPIPATHTLEPFDIPNEWYTTISNYLQNSNNYNVNALINASHILGRYRESNTGVMNPNDEYQTDLNLRHVYIPATGRQPISYNLSVNLTNYALELLNPIRQHLGLAPLTTNPTIIHNAINALPKAKSSFHDGYNWAPDLSKFNITNYYFGDSIIDTKAYSQYEKGAFHPQPVNAPAGYDSIDNYHRQTYMFLIDAMTSGDDFVTDVLLNPNTQALAVQYKNHQLYIFTANPATPSANTSAPRIALLYNKLSQLFLRHNLLKRKLITLCNRLSKLTPN